MMQSLLPPPAFVNDAFALKILLDMGGRASFLEIRDYIHGKYDLTTFPHLIRYLRTQYMKLQSHGFLDVQRAMTDRERRYFIVDDARAAAEKLATTSR